MMSSNSFQSVFLFNSSFQSYVNRLFFFYFVVILILLAQFVCVITPASAQQNDKNRKVTGALNGDFEVVRPYKPVLAEANKIRIEPDSAEDRKRKNRMKYTIPDKKVEIPPYVQSLPFLNYNNPPNTSTFFNQNFVAAAFGLYGSALGELHLNSGDKLGRFNMAFWANSALRQSSSDYPQNNRNDVGLSMTYHSLRHVVKSKIYYQAADNHFMSFDDKRFDVNKQLQDYQKFQAINANVSISNVYQSNPNHLSYVTKINTYLLQARADVLEKRMSLTSQVIQPNKQRWGINMLANYDFITAKFSDFKTVNIQEQSLHQFNFQPKLIYLYRKIRVVAGFDFTYLSYSLPVLNNDKSAFYIFPQLSFTLPIASGVATIYAALAGNTQINTFKTSIEQNPFFLRTNYLERSIEKMTLNVGSKVALFPNVSFSLDLNYKQVNHLQVFALVNNVNTENMPVFTTNYITGDTEIFGATSEVSADFNRKVTFQAQFNYKYYSMPNGDRPWFLPNLTAYTHVQYRVFKNYHLGTSLSWNGTSTGLVKNFQNQNDFKSVSNPAFVNWGLDTEYKSSKRWTVFIRVNNLLNQSYRQFLVYPRYPLTVYGGLGYIF